MSVFSRALIDEEINLIDNVLEELYIIRDKCKALTYWETTINKYSDEEFKSHFRYYYLINFISYIYII